MKVISWNIKHGGGKRVHRIIEAIKDQEPDVIVIPEFRNNRNGKLIRSSLLEIGMIHQSVADVESNLNTVLIASNESFVPSFFNDELGKWGHRVVRAEFEGLVVYGMYFPQRKEKEQLFKFILENVPVGRDRPTLFIGDLNTGKHYIDEEMATFYCSGYMDKVERAGLVDGWRHLHEDRREYTWYSTSGNGFRIDHAFGSDKLSDLIKGCKYDHGVREAGTSDHSMLILDLSF